jgi:hypothetical protein
MRVDVPDNKGEPCCGPAPSHSAQQMQSCAARGFFGNANSAHPQVAQAISTSIVFAIARPSGMAA